MQSIDILLQQPKERLGSQLEKLSQVLANPFGRNAKVCFDFSAIEFIYPNWVVPLRAYMDWLRSKGHEVTMVNHAHLTYLDTIYFTDPLDPSAVSDFEQRLALFKVKNYLPILRLPTQKNTASTFVDQSLSTLTGVVCAQLDASAVMKTALSYFIDELCNNVLEHANASHIWIGAQFYSPRGYLDFCICDTGKGFLQSYLDHGKFSIHTHAEAMEKATSGLSTKDKEKNRGFGLATSRNLILDGLKGRMAVSSGNAMRIDLSPNEGKIIEPERFHWPGVLLNVRLYPDNHINVSKYYE